MTELDIPSGDQEDQAPPPTTDSGLKETAVDVGMKKDDKNKKPMMIAGLFVCVLLVAAILVGVLPNWKKKDEKKKNTEDTLSTSASRCQEGCLKITDDTFNVTLPLFSERITEGYLTLDEFKEDMKELGKYFLNDAIRNSYWVSYDDAIGITNTEESGQPMPEFDSALTENGTNTGDSSKVSGADAYETNNQEFTVDRADFVKSDGNYMFAAFSDHLVVLAKDGEGVLFKKKMKPIDVNITDPCGGAWGCIEPMPVAIDAEEGATVEVTARSDVFPGWKNPVPRIQALLIHGNHLTAVISGYGAEHSEKLGRTPSIYEYLGTRIQVYEIGSTGDLHLISEQDVNGNFMNAYSKGEFVHIITRSSINTWTLLEPMDRGQPAFEGMDDTQYREAVIKLVDEGLLDRFVEDLISELQVSGPVDLARLSFFTDSIAADNADQDLYYSSLATSISQVVSFDLSAVSGSTTSVGTIQPHMAATFHPGSGGQVYAMGSMVIIAEYSWSWIPDENRSVDKTFLVCFSLSGASSTHSRVGTVDGTLLSPFSLDYVERSSGNYVRVATTQNFWMPWVGTAEGGDQPVSSEAAVTPVEASSTLNQIIVLKVPSDSTASLVSVGSVELGEPNERFTAVRFFDDFAYAVTFEQTDPFYVVDLSGEEPTVSGELKVSGFSDYLHPINGDDTLLLAIGYDADETGSILGYQLSLFDASDASNPTLVNRLVIENDENTWTSSSASWEERAFRFLPLGEGKGKAIIPVSLYKYQEFDESGQLLATPISETFEGFSVFNIENGQITKDFDIDHSLEVPYDEACNHYFEWLPERSFVFDGNVVTMKMHTVISTSLTTGQTLWTVPVNETYTGCVEV